MAYGDEGDAAGTGGKPSRRIVLGTGRGLDKRDRFEMTKKISTDWDLQKPSLLGSVLWSVVLRADTLDCMEVEMEVSSRGGDG